MDINLRGGARKFQPPNYMVIDQICDPSQAEAIAIWEEKCGVSSISSMTCVEYCGTHEFL